MTDSRNSTPLHPPAEVLSLLSSGDLPLRMHWRVRRHVSRCEICSEELSRFQVASEQLHREAETETLTGFEAIADWRRLEREMLGNIGVGVAAGRCIEKVGFSRLKNWRGALIVASLSVVFVGGWLMNMPNSLHTRLADSIRGWTGTEAPHFSGTVVQTTPSGIAVRAQGATLTLMHSGPAVVNVAGDASVGARYVDEETGQVTITKVYGQ